MTDEYSMWRWEPTLRDLRELERIGDRRDEIARADCGDERQAQLRRLLIGVLDEMEEALCLYGWRSRPVTEGWRSLAGFESFDRDEM